MICGGGGGIAPSPGGGGARVGRLIMTGDVFEAVFCAAAGAPGNMPITAMVNMMVIGERAMCISPCTAFIPTAAGDPSPKTPIRDRSFCP